MITGNIKPTDFRKFGIASQLVPVFIDNHKLDGFLEGMQKIDCANRICNDTVWHGNGIEKGDCSYCRNFAEKALQIDEEKRQKAIEINNQLLENILA